MMKSNWVSDSWETVCSRQLGDIYDHYYGWYTGLERLESINPIVEIENHLNYIIEYTEGFTKPITPAVLSGLDNNYIFFDIAAYAIFMVDALEDFVIDRHHICEILIKKQKDYGPANIMKFGPTGIIIRLYDKIARLWNLTENTGNINLYIKLNNHHNESIIDTLIDIIGYSTIALMVLDPDPIHKNKFLTPMNQNNHQQC